MSRMRGWSVGLAVLAVLGASSPLEARLHRSQAARHAFMRQTGFPQGRPGYVIDHVIPLACGGADTPENMQWQTVAAAKAKDRVERVGCQHSRENRVSDALTAGHP